MLRRLKQKGITILVSTPYMDEATLCDRIALIQEGKLLSVDTPGQLVESYPGTLYAVRSDSMYKLLIDLRTYEDTDKCFTFGDYLHLSFKSAGEGQEPKLLQYLAEKGHKHVILKVTTPTVEDCFIKLTGTTAA
jgi:ABC-type multidrug transport system ATPase subunit